MGAPSNGVQVRVNEAASPGGKSAAWASVPGTMSRGAAVAGERWPLHYPHTCSPRPCMRVSYCRMADSAPLTPRQRVEAACARLGTQEVVSRCVDALLGRAIDDDFIRALVGPPA